MERFGLVETTPPTSNFAFPWIRIDSAQLQKHYYLSWPSLLAGEKPAAEETESEAESEGHEGQHGDHDGQEGQVGEDSRVGQAEENAESESGKPSGEQMKKRKKSKKKGKKKSGQGGDDYDFDDPFIDDDEAPHAVYESIFDLMAQAGSDAEEEDDALEGIGQDQRRQRRQFYVYRGKLLQQQQLMGEEGETEGESINQPRKRSRRNSASSSPKRKAKPESRPAKKRPATEKPKGKAKSALDMIMALGKEGAEEVEIQEPAEEEQVGGMEGEEEQLDQKDSGSASQRPRGSPVKKLVPESDRQHAELELRLALEAFEEQAGRLAGTFDPIKFPSALKTPLTDSVVAQLRLSTLLGQQPAEMISSLLAIFEKLAGCAPYSAGSLRKLVMKRILPALVEEFEQRRLPSHYQSISLLTNQTVEVTLAEPEVKAGEADAKIGEAPVKTDEAEINAGEAPVNAGVAEVKAGAAEVEATPSQQQPPKFRVTEPLREVIYEIVRFEWDLSLIKRALRLFDEAQAASALTEPVESEHVNRKAAYVKIHRAWCNRWEVTTYDISREYSTIKRKLERALMKRHGVEVAVKKRERKPKDEAKGQVIRIVPMDEYIKSNDGGGFKVAPKSVAEVSSIALQTPASNHPMAAVEVAHPIPEDQQTPTDSAALFVNQ